MQNAFDARVAEAMGNPLHCAGLDTIQVNIGLVCNLECVHCHVSSSPRRKENMQWDTMEHILRAAREVSCRLIDITGGAPEMNPHFRRFVETARAQGQQVMVRTNLTILLETGMEYLPDFFKSQQVHLVASMPCYLQDNVDKQRGEGVYRDSIEALKRLNTVGYGMEPELPLSLVYNPVGPHLPPNQKSLEADYKRELDHCYGIRFTNLYTITNMPIGRFKTDLRRQKKEREYIDLLHNSFNPGTLDGLMCRHQINVDWDGTLYDCDFNLALRMPVNHGTPTNIREFHAQSLAGRRIVTGDHCFGCTAGCGSSCGGALVSVD